MATKAKLAENGASRSLDFRTERRRLQASAQRVHRPSVSSFKRSDKKEDSRVRRTRDRLRVALRELIQKKSLQEITVQDVLNDAGVSRSTFYAHFSNTSDLFLTDMDEFLGMMSMHLSRSGEKSERVAPIREFFAHVRGAEQVRLALARSDRLTDFFDLAREHFARGIERRLSQIPRSSTLPKTERTALSYALSGAMISQLDWWTRGSKRPSAEQIDLAFHQLVWTGIPRAQAEQKKLRPK